MAFEPLEKTWTYRQLISKRGPDSGWYGACALGNRQARETWATQVGRQRLHEIASLRQEFAAVTAKYATSLRLLKGEQLRAIKEGRDATRPTRDLQILSRRVLADVELFVNEKGKSFEALGFPPEACLDLARAAMEHLMSHTSADWTWQIPDEMLSRFPADAQLYLRPATRSDQVAAGPAMATVE